MALTVVMAGCTGSSAITSADRFQSLVHHLNNSGWKQLATGTGTSTHRIHLPAGSPTFTIACSGRVAMFTLTRNGSRFGGLTVNCPGSGTIRYDAQRKLPDLVRVSVKSDEQWALFERSRLVAH